MNNSIFTDFQDNNFEEDRNNQSIVVAIANTSLTKINEHIAEAGLDELTALDALTSAITAFLLDLGRKFEDMKQALKPKEKFRDLVEAMGKPVTFVNKLIRATKVAENFPMTTAYMLGIDILAQLAQSKYADLIDDFINHPPENQLEASDRIKEFARSQPKKPKTPWLQRGSHKTTDGLPREYQAPIVSETAGLIIEQESENTGMPPRVFVEKAVQAFVEPKVVEELDVFTAAVEHHSEEAEELKAIINKLELEKTSTETTLAQIVETAIALPLNLVKSLLPLSLPLKSAHIESTVKEESSSGRGSRAAGGERVDRQLVFSSPASPASSAPEASPASAQEHDSVRELVPIGSLKKPKSEKVFAIGEMVMYCGVIYTVESEPDADGDVECRMANGRSRVLAMQFLKKCEVS